MAAKGYKAEVLAALPGPICNIAVKVGITEMPVRRWLGIIGAEGGCHIAKWQRSGGNFQAVYVAGPGINAECKLRAHTGKQHSKRFIRNAKASGRYEEILAKQRGKRWADSAVRKAAKRPNNWASSLGLPTIAGAA